MELLIPDGPNADMWHALIEHDNNKLSTALRAGADPNFVDHNGMEPAMMAAFCLNAGAVQLLAERGARYPAPAGGTAFDAYFDIDPPRYYLHSNHSAWEIAFKNKDADLLRLLVEMPGAAEHVLTSESPVTTYGISEIVRSGDLRLAKTLVGAHARHRWGNVNFTLGERALVHQMINEFFLPLLSAVDCAYFEMHSAAEHLDDRGINSHPDTPAVHALAFNVQHDELAGSRLAIPQSADQLKVDRPGGYEQFEAGVWQVSDNIVIRLSRCTSLDRGSCSDDEPCRSTSFRGTIYLCESAAYLKRALDTLGDVGATTQLLHAITRFGTHDEPGDAPFSCDQQPDDIDLPAPYHRSYDEVVSALKAGADSSLSWFGSCSADVVAAYNCRSSALRALLENDPSSKKRLARTHFPLIAPVNAVAERRYSNGGRVVGLRCPEMLSDESEYVDVIEILVSAGANAAPRLPCGSTALSLACKNGDLPMVDLLLAAGADVSSSNPTCARPLVEAAGSENSLVVERVLAAGADPNAQDDKGRLPLLHAAVRSDLPAMVRLLAAGAEPGPALERINEGSISVRREMLSLLQAHNAKSAILAAARKRPIAAITAS